MMTFVWLIGTQNLFVLALGIQKKHSDEVAGVLGLDAGGSWLVD